MRFRGEPFVDLDGVPWGSLPTLKTVQLEKGQRYPIEVVGIAELRGESHQEPPDDPFVPPHECAERGPVACCRGGCEGVIGRLQLSLPASSGSTARR